MTTFLPSSHKFAIACGAAGAFVEVTSDTVLNEGAVTRSWGRTDAFSDAAPGTFSFTLDNRDGKYTPGYVTGIAPVVLPLAKGMGVSWELNGQIRSGRIRSVVPIFPSEGKPDAARVRVTVDDVLAIAARTTVESLGQSMVVGSSPYFHWSLEDDAVSEFAEEDSGRLALRLRRDSTPPIFGRPGVEGYSSKQVELVSAPAASALVSGDLSPVSYAGTSLGWWSFVVTPPTSGLFSANFYRTAGISSLTSSVFFDTTAGSGGTWCIAGVGIGYTTTDVPVVPGVPTHISFGGTLSGFTSTFTLYVNGVLAGSRSNSSAGSYSPQPTAVDISLANSKSSAFISNLSHTPNRVDGYAAIAGTEAERLIALSSTVPALVLDTLPSDLGTDLLGPQGSGSVLDLMNEVIRGEQGHLYSVSSGTLLAPVEKVVVRSRTRPTAVTATFDVATDIIGAPDMGYDTTNTVSSATVSGPHAQATVYDKALEAVVGTANTSASLAFSSVVALRSFGEDRLIRGISSGVDVFSIVVNARSTTVSRWADMLAMTPGLRYRITGLPTAQLGFSQWDGWFLGASELHDQENNLFTLHFERTLPATGVFDTDRFMSGGETSLSAGINSSVTSMSVATIGARMSTTDLPYKVQVDNEIVNVTAASGATPQVLTIQRAQNGTTAAAHSSGALVESYPDTLFAY